MTTPVNVKDLKLNLSKKGYEYNFVLSLCSAPMTGPPNNTKSINVPKDSEKVIAMNPANNIQCPKAGSLEVALTWKFVMTKKEVAAPKHYPDKVVNIPFAKGFQQLTVQLGKVGSISFQAEAPDIAAIKAKEAEEKRKIQEAENARLAEEQRKIDEQRALEQAATRVKEQIEEFRVQRQQFETSELEARNTNEGQWDVTHVQLEAHKDYLAKMQKEEREAAIAEEAARPPVYPTLNPELRIAKLFEEPFSVDDDPVYEAICAKPSLPPPATLNGEGPGVGTMNNGGGGRNSRSGSSNVNANTAATAAAGGGGGGGGGGRGVSPQTPTPTVKLDQMPSLSKLTPRERSLLAQHVMTEHAEERYQQEQQEHFLQQQQQQQQGAASTPRAQGGPQAAVDYSRQTPLDLLYHENNDPDTVTPKNEQRFFGAENPDSNFSQTHYQNQYEHGVDDVSPEERDQMSPEYIKLYRMDPSHNDPRNNNNNNTNNSNYNNSNYNNNNNQSATAASGENPLHTLRQEQQEIERIPLSAQHYRTTNQQYLQQQQEAATGVSSSSTGGTSTGNSSSKKNVSFGGPAASGAGGRTSSTTSSAATTNTANTNTASSSSAMKKEPLYQSPNQVHQQQHGHGPNLGGKMGENEPRFEIDLDPAPPLMQAMLHLSRDGGNLDASVPISHQQTLIDVQNQERIMFLQQQQQNQRGGGKQQQQQFQVSPSRSQQRYYDSPRSASGGRGSPHNSPTSASPHRENSMTPRRTLPLVYTSQGEVVSRSSRNDSRSIPSFMCGKRIDTKRVTTVDSAQSYWNCFAPHKAKNLVGVRMPASAAIAFEEAAEAQVEASSPPRRVTNDVPQKPRSVRSEQAPATSLRKIVNPNAGHLRDYGESSSHRADHRW